MKPFFRTLASNLPPHTRFVEIKGGNHAQFGYYGFQLGDHRATIPREQQQAELLRAILLFLEQISQPAENSSRGAPAQQAQ